MAMGVPPLPSLVLRSIRRAYAERTTGTQPAGPDGFRERFFKGLFLTFVFCAATAATSTRPLRRMPQWMVFSFLDSAEHKDRAEACLLLKAQPTNERTSRRGKLSRSLKVGSSFRAR